MTLAPSEADARFDRTIDRWFRGPLKDELRAVLLDPVAQARGLFRPEAVARLVDEHVLGLRDHAYKLWALLMLELWFRHHLDARPPGVLASGAPAARIEAMPQPRLP